jgi:hypothetical protein
MLFHVVHVLLVLVEIRSTCTRYTYHECGYLMCRGSLCCGYFYVGCIS